MIRKVSSALAALAFVACAHGGASAHRTAGRAAQPFGWPESMVDGAEPTGAVTMTSAPLGRAAQPFGWPERLGAVTTGPLSKSPATDYVGARAAQPFGWPEQVIAQEQAATTSALRKAAAAQ